MCSNETQSNENLSGTILMLIMCLGCVPPCTIRSILSLRDREDFTKRNKIKHISSI